MSLGLTSIVNSFKFLRSIKWLKFENNSSSRSSFKHEGLPPPMYKESKKYTRIEVSVQETNIVYEGQITKWKESLGFRKVEQK